MHTIDGNILCIVGQLVTIISMERGIPILKVPIYLSSVAHVSSQTFHGHLSNYYIFQLSYPHFFIKSDFTFSLKKMLNGNDGVTSVVI